MWYEMLGARQHRDWLRRACAVEVELSEATQLRCFAQLRKAFVAEETAFAVMVSAFALSRP